MITNRASKTRETVWRRLKLVSHAPCGARRRTQKPAASAWRVGLGRSVYSNPQYTMTWPLPRRRVPRLNFSLYRAQKPKTKQHTCCADGCVMHNQPYGARLPSPASIPSTERVKKKHNASFPNNYFCQTGIYIIPTSDQNTCMHITTTLPARDNPRGHDLPRPFGKHGATSSPTNTHQQRESVDSLFSTGCDSPLP